MNLKIKLLSFFAIFLISSQQITSNQTNHIQTIYLGSGCFWGAEKGYEQLEGVIDAESGYANGYGISPNYRSITQFKNKYNENNFAEVVKVTFPKFSAPIWSMTSWASIPSAPIKFSNAPVSMAFLIIVIPLEP